jgi:uncharacterized protein YggE
MTQPATTLVSVRGEASVVVAPDEAQVSCAVRASAHDRSASVDLARTQLTALLAALSERGGVVRTADTLLAPLSWSASGMTTHEEIDEAARFRTSIGVRVFVRALEQFQDVMSVLSVLDGSEIWQVTWTVDDDNPAWTGVRADAIRSALRRGSDYARALGGTITAVQHVADAGLLGGDTAATVRMGAAAFSAAGAGGDVSLDPEPQRLTAVIDARFVATVGGSALTDQGS